MLFGECRKDKVRMRHRQESQLRLRAFRDTLPPKRPRAHRDLGLNHLIARSLWILTGVDETHQPGLLIVLQKIISDWKNNGQSYYNDRRMLPSQSGEHDS